jgi:peptidoglycan hydrolase CwlO-like protein
VLEQLIEARAAEQNFSSQLATRAGQVQQLACDRDLALQKLCHSEEKLVALEAQLISLESQLQERQEGIAAQVAALDVAALAAGPLAGEEAGVTRQVVTSMFFLQIVCMESLSRC